MECPWRQFAAPRVGNGAVCIWLYAGKPVYPALPRNVRMGVYHGDNVSGAENQQERLSEFRGWVIGFVDGEGCFSIGFVRQPDRTGRKGYRTGYQVSHDFVVTQGASSVGCLHDLCEFFGSGEGVRQPEVGQPPGEPSSLRRLSPAGSTGVHHPVLSGVSAPDCKTARLREVRFLCRARRSRSPQDPPWACGDRRDRADDESTET
jgi:hypothetical protein